MTTKDETILTETKTIESGGEVVIDIGKMYSYDPKDLEIDITVVGYSNLAYITIAHRDVFIDFLEMPGIKRDGKVLINGTRVYMSHVAAKALADRLNETLEQVYLDGKIEEYIAMKKPDKK